MSLNTHEYSPFRLQTKQFHIIFYTLSPSFPAHTSHPATTTFLQADTQSSTPLHSKYPSHLNLLWVSPPPPDLHTLKTWKTVQTLTNSVLQPHSTHGSHHHKLCSLQTADFQPSLLSVSVIGAATARVRTLPTFGILTWDPPKIL